MGTHGDMEEGILEIQPRTHGVFLEPFPDCFNVFHTEINMTNIFVKFNQVQDRSPFVRNSLRFQYCKVCNDILPWYWAHLIDGSFLEKFNHFFIKN